MARVLASVVARFLDLAADLRTVSTLDRNIIAFTITMTWLLADVGAISKEVSLMFHTLQQAL
jgi:hypothetical protein